MGRDRSRSMSSSSS
ncbi:unnamed protein product, partial [Adineta steineri]